MRRRVIPVPHGSEKTANQVFEPVRSLYKLGGRGCEDADLSSLIVQNDLIKKDRKLAYRQHDIDDCNHLVQSYVLRGVRENSSYYLRRRLVETFGQSHSGGLINRMRLVAVLLGGEKGRGGMDPVFTPIREEAHRISPYVVVQVQAYIDKLASKMGKARLQSKVSEDFKRYVDTLGSGHESERRIADIGSTMRNQPAKELYALNALLRDLRTYYGERVEDSSGSPPYEVLFEKLGTFRSENLTELKKQHRSMKPAALGEAFISLGLELRNHLSELRRSSEYARRGSSEEVPHLMKLNEIVASGGGLFASGRDKLSPQVQAQKLVDLLFLEGLYSKKERKALHKELEKTVRFGPGREAEIHAFHGFLNYMSGLAHTTLDEGFGDAVRAFINLTPTAENYLEVQARKSALQVLGQLQVEFYQKHRSVLAGTKDIHLAGKARGRLKVFSTQREISDYLKADPANGAGTLWVLKGGLNMPNEASFAAIILEDPIMKASHYDGYARSQRPPIPLMQIPGAVEAYSNYDGKLVLLEATKAPKEKLVITEGAGIEPPEMSEPSNRKRLAFESKTSELVEISGARTPEELHSLTKQVGAKAANYAFLRSSLPLNVAAREEHIYPGFAIPYHFYEAHVRNSGVDREIARLTQLRDPREVQKALWEIRNQIQHHRVDDKLLRLIRQHMEGRLRSQFLQEESIVKLRFRSSSNAEDNQDFSGAGLYESHHAFYTYGNPTDTVSHAIRAVWASAWKSEAYQARKLAGLIQETVRMGVLVHPSYRKEESTGVVFYYSPDDIEIVANAGNENVQNPTNAGLAPEMHRISESGYARTPSSRYALSKKKILSQKDRKQLMSLLEKVVPKFQALYADQQVAGVDVEFKVLELPDSKGDQRDVVMLKQIRPLTARSE
ncbi:PEP/pyruvate-binding domain-containing protein [bacterium]|nr:PEP/pyruvate-binding domain-containing protein [bacterium]